VLAEWSPEALGAELRNDLPACYILTNSRSLPLAAARALNAEIGRNLAEAARLTGRAVVLVSRSDSTLRGHFPGEVEALAQAFAPAIGGFDAWLLVPFFLEGGRYTIDDVHYVADGQTLVPAGETEFARDHAFGYRSSNLRKWVEEKTGGGVPAGSVHSITLDDLRRGGPERAAARLLALPRGSVCIGNAASYRDLEVFVRGLLAAEAAGGRYLHRTAASFVAVRAGIERRPLLTPGDLGLAAEGCGLIVAGSYVPRTTAQLEEVTRLPGLAVVEVEVEALLAEERRATEIERAAREASASLERGMDVAVMTSRRLVTGADAEGSLRIGAQVSEALVAIVRGIAVRPRYIVAKGGITSSDIATRGLDVRRAMVLGQIAAGVPVWQLGAESRYPGLAYVVFPGNVGGAETLAEIVGALRAGKQAPAIQE
jgi:uncharacterized protein YgbK (DUF1537 family)